MRNTTKLKHVLSRYSMGVDLNDEGIFCVTLVDKFNHDKMYSLEAESWSKAMVKAYSHLIKSIDIKK